MGRPKRQPLSPRLLEYRQRAGLTQDEVAERMGITADMVRRHERGMSQPIALYRTGYCQLYRADEVQLGLKPSAGPALTTANDVVVSGGPDDELADVLNRVRRLEHKSIGETTLGLMDSSVIGLVYRHEDEGPKPLITTLVAKRAELDGLIATSNHPKERRRLFSIAGQVSGLLAYGAVNRGKYDLARALNSESWLLAEYAENSELQAWVRGTQSFCEYYAGNYSLAVDYARDGLTLANGGPQSVRLAVNGEARALAKLGDHQGVRSAVERSYKFLEKNSVVPGVSPCASFGGYSLARTASNAVTAYVSLGLTDEVVQHAAIASPEFAASTSQWSQALLRLDMANSMIADTSGDVNEAASLVTEALTISSGKPISSVVTRSREFITSVQKRWGDVPSVATVRDAVLSTQLS